MNKEFSKELFRKHDQDARDATKNFLSSKGWLVTDHPDRYAQDLVARKGDIEVLVECEVKLGWRNGKFPFDTVQLPERKAKFFVPSTAFFIWNKPLTEALYFWSPDIQHLEPALVPNKYMKKEYFYRVPLNLTKTTKENEYSRIHNS